MQNQFDESSRNCGEILRYASQIESILEIFISDYFVYNYKNSRKHLLNALIYRLNFEKKFEIFKLICKEEKCFRHKIKKIEKNVKFVQEIRNKVAHGSHVISGEGIRISPRKIRLDNQDMTYLTPNLVQEILENTDYVINKILELRDELSSSNRI